MAAKGSGPLGTDIPRWAYVVVLPIVNLIAAFLVSGLVVLIIGENPLEVVRILIWGAFGFQEAIGYTLFYATNFIFTGLAVSIAFHCMLFNIGGEGQAYFAGLGIALVGLQFDFLPPIVLIPLCMVSAALFGAAWAFIPAYLQAKRGSHIVITTIMFNFIASSVMVYLLVNVLIEPGSMHPQSREFTEAGIPSVHEALGWLGIEFAASPWNLSFLWALVCCVLVWGYVWHTRWGFEMRTVGISPTAAGYAGISETKSIIITMCISGALAGFLGLNEIMGYHHRLLLHFSGGYGFVGIAVALMGRSHPVGVCLAAILFGALYQGGAELSFEIPTITRELVIVIQGLVIIFAGALEFMFKPQVEAVFRWLTPRRSQAAAAE